MLGSPIFGNPHIVPWCTLPWARAVFSAFRLVFSGLEDPECSRFGLVASWFASGFRSFTSLADGWEVQHFREHATPLMLLLSCTANIKDLRLDPTSRLYYSND